MPVPPELMAAKEALEGVVLALPGVTGIDVGVRDDDEPDFMDLAIRVFVGDLSSIPPGIPSEVTGFPVVVRQRRYDLQLLPDTGKYRPVRGGVSTGPARLLDTPFEHFARGTLGAVVRDAGNAGVFGLSNFHVLAVDSTRKRGHRIVQPEATILGVIPGTDIGALERWAFPETVQEGEVDGAICSLTATSIATIEEIGIVNGTAPPEIGMAVRKRGKTSGLTFGHILGTAGIHFLNLAGYGVKRFKRQIEIKVDFPQSVFWSQHGDSGSLVVTHDRKAVGLHFAAWDKENDGMPQWGIANPIDAVARDLGISFYWPLPRIDLIVPPAASPGSVVAVVGAGFLLASGLRFGDDSAAFQVVHDGLITAQIPFGVGTVSLSIDGPGGTGVGGHFDFLP